MTLRAFDKAEILRTLAGQLITVAAMADASSLFDCVFRPSVLSQDINVSRQICLQFALARNEADICTEKIPSSASAIGDRLRDAVGLKLALSEASLTTLIALLRWSLAHHFRYVHDITTAFWEYSLYSTVQDLPTSCTGHFHVTPCNHLHVLHRPWLKGDATSDILELDIWLGSKCKEQLVMAFSVISISSDSSEESVGTSTARVILFGTIPTIVPATTLTVDLPVIHDDTLLIPTDTPTISPIVPTIPSIAPTIQYTSSFICTDSSNSDTPDTPTSPIHDIPHAEISLSTRQILHAPPGLPYRLAVLVLPEQSIPVGRPYPDYSPSDHFTSDDSSRDYSSNSSSETSSDSHSDTSSDSSLGHSSLVPVTSPVREALSPVYADLLPPRKRIRDSDSADIDACIAFADDIAARWTDVRVEIGNAAEEEAESSARGMIEIGVDRITHPAILDDIVELVREDFPESVSADGSLEVMQRGLDVVIQELYDHMVEIPVHRVRVIESVQRNWGHRIVATSQQSTAMSEMISTLERDNMRLRGMLGVERQRVDHLRHKALQAYDTAKNLGTETEMENEQQDDNVEVNGNNGNGNGNGNGNPNVNNGGTEGVVGLTRWFEKIETIFHISNCPPKYQVKYASCTLFDGALIWWNSHKRTVGVEAAYAMTWKAFMKLMTERFQKLTLLCTNMVPKEDDQVKKYIGGLQDNIQGNVIAAEPIIL
ncbi:hypothetical protein Tco_0001310 [Tanacetum coccineum]